MGLFVSILPIAWAATAEPTIQGIIAKFQNEILLPVISLLFLVATIVFLWGVIQYVIIGSQGASGALEKGKAVMKWGIIGMTVMASAWGIVRLICTYFGTSCNIQSWPMTTSSSNSSNNTRGYLYNNNNPPTLEGLKLSPIPKSTENIGIPQTKNNSNLPINPKTFYSPGIPPPAGFTAP